MRTKSLEFFMKILFFLLISNLVSTQPYKGQVHEKWYHMDEEQKIFYS